MLVGSLAWGGFVVCVGVGLGVLFSVAGLGVLLVVCMLLLSCSYGCYLWFGLLVFIALGLICVLAVDCVMAGACLVVRFSGLIWCFVGW